MYLVTFKKIYLIHSKLSTIFSTPVDNYYIQQKQIFKADLG